MDEKSLANVQQRVSQISIPWLESLHGSPDVADKEFRPWTSGLSPSALYNCSLGCRKRMKLKTPEVKWMSIKRWVSKTPNGIELPPGVFLSIKRKEQFVVQPTPHFSKIEYILLMFPYGNVWSQQSPDVPITEDWLWSETNGMLIFEALMRRDAAHPVQKYFATCYEFMQKNPDQIGIHLKRKRKDSEL